MRRLYSRVQTVLGRLESGSLLVITGNERACTVERHLPEAGVTYTPQQKATLTLFSTIYSPLQASSCSDPGLV